MGNALSKTTSVRLHNKSSLKIDNYLLDCYALNKYGTTYDGSKREVNADIRELYREYAFQTVREIKYYLTLSFLSPEKRAVMVDIYSDKVNSQA